jgi:hypothetical protein
MRNYRGHELELLEQRLSELLRHAAAVKRSLAGLTIGDFAGEPLEGGFRELTSLLAETVGDVTLRLQMLEEVVTSMDEQALI